MRWAGRIAGVALLLLAGATGAAGESFRFEGGRIEIPAGFAGPVEQRRGPDLALYGFTKRHPGRETATLMQITVLRPPGGPPAAGQEAEAAAKYLLELLAGVERRRTDFERGPVESIVVDGKVAAKVRWRGRAEGQPMTGVMYCYLHGARVISFHTQDLDAAPADGLLAAVHAFETASIGETAGPAPPPPR